MRRVKAWTKMALGALVTLASIVSVFNFAFETALLSIPASLVIAAVVMLGGALLFVSGLIERDELRGPGPASAKSEPRRKPRVLPLP